MEIELVSAERMADFINIAGASIVRAATPYAGTRVKVIGPDYYQSYFSCNMHNATGMLRRYNVPECLVERVIDDIRPGLANCNNCGWAGYPEEHYDQCASCGRKRSLTYVIVGSRKQPKSFDDQIRSVLTSSFKIPTPF